MLKIEFGCRWEEAVQTALEKLGGGEKILYVQAKADYQGYLDLDVLLSDGRVFSYFYSYGSCSWCDPWIGGDLDEGYDSGYPKLADHMIQEATIFANVAEWEIWARKAQHDYSPEVSRWDARVEPSVSGNFNPAQKAGKERWKI